jgi:subtilase family serine protease
VGTVAQVSELLGVTFAPVAGQPASVHTVSGTPRFPDALQKLVVHVGGLDTRVRALHHIALSQGGNGFGPQDVRRFYSETPLHQQGWVGQGQTLAVLSTATSPTASPDIAAITYFMRNVSDVKTAFIQVASSNAGNDVDTDANAGSEYNLDVEMQSISVPGAESITLVAAPASQVFVAGPQFIVNNLPNLTAVSVSLGTCEANEINFGGAEAVARTQAGHLRLSGLRSPR